MNEIEQLRDFLDTGDKRFEIDSNWEYLDLELGDVDSEAILVVAATTDALKNVSGGRVQNSVDRDQLWEIVGFSVTPGTVAKLLESGFAGDLLAGVTAVGVEWEVIDRSAAPSAPNM